jgi:hypothetical protein
MERSSNNTKKIKEAWIQTWKHIGGFSACPKFLRRIRLPEGINPVYFKAVYRTLWEETVGQHRIEVILTYEDLAHLAEVSTATVKRAVKFWVELGLLEKKTRYNGHRKVTRKIYGKIVEEYGAKDANAYRITPARVTEVLARILPKKENLDDEQRVQQTFSSEELKVWEIHSEGLTNTQSGSGRPDIDKKNSKKKNKNYDDDSEATS